MPRAPEIVALIKQGILDARDTRVHPDCAPGIEDRWTKEGRFFYLVDKDKHDAYMREMGLKK
jgi:hypothetical protein